MAERPIIFSAAMVRAILDGRKTQTRRVVRLPKWGTAIDEIGDDGYTMWCVARDSGCLSPALPQYLPTDTLWVREAFALGHYYDDEGKPIGDLRPFYAATMDVGRWYDPDADQWRDRPRWRPSIHMPRWASRITLRVTGVRVERLHDISEEDAIAEGVLVGQLPGCFHSGIGTLDVEWRSTATHAFEHLWESINGPGTWDANPWVVAISFERLHA
jgi:hypothetical protein